ncbi:hypothetical protein NVS55_28390 [Myxococcus stipitatus]|uniref:hypothetical protein n=1 Tax=Myxococcus stipitatus TaxID=83455 RepID=UPI003144E237
MRAERIIVGAVFIGTLCFQWWSAQEQRESLASLQNELERVSTTVERLRDSTARAERNRAMEVWSAAPTQKPSHAQPTTGTVMSDEQEQTAPVHAPSKPFDSDSAQSQVERAFEQESSDSGWASEAQREMRATLSSNLPTSASVRVLDCRTTLCRLEIDFPAETDFRETMGRPGGMARFWKGPSMARIERDAVRGSVTVVSYLVRMGHPMPFEPQLHGRPTEHGE